MRFDDRVRELLHCAPFFHQLASELVQQICLQLGVSRQTVEEKFCCVHFLHARHSLVGLHKHEGVFRQILRSRIIDGFVDGLKGRLNEMVRACSRSMSNLLPEVEAPALMSSLLRSHQCCAGVSYRTLCTVARKLGRCCCCRVLTVRSSTTLSFRT